MNRLAPFLLSYLACAAAFVGCGMAVHAGGERAGIDFELWHALPALVVAALVALALNGFARKAVRGPGTNTIALVAGLAALFGARFLYLKHAFDVAHAYSVYDDLIASCLYWTGALSFLALLVAGAFRRRPAPAA